MEDTYTGHDDRWFSNQGTQTEFDGTNSVPADSQRRITDLEKEIVHMKTHCLIYRHALLKTPHGLESVHSTLESFLMRDKPVCSDCEKDDLITALACLKKTDDSSPLPIRFTNEIVSPILSSGGAMKRRKLMSKEKEEHHNAHR